MSELVTLAQPALNFGFADGLERYHTASDDIAHLHKGSLQHHGVQALALARAFADGPLPRPRAGDAVFFTVPGVGLILYPEWSALPFSTAAVALVLVGVLRVRRCEPHWIRGLSLGLAGIVVSTALAAAMAFGVIRIVDRLAGPPTMGGSASARGLYAVAIATLALGSASTSWALIRRWTGLAGAWTGALLVWAVVAILVTSRLPGASYVFVWPLLAAACAALVAVVSERAPVRSLANWAATLVAASVIVPAVHFVAVVILGLSDPGAIIVGMFVPMCAWLLAPHLETLGAMRGWLTPAITLVGAFVLVGTSMAIARPSAAHPEASMLAYAFDVDTSRAWLVTLPEFARRGSWAAEVLGPSARTVIPRMHTTSDEPPEWLTRAIGGESRTLAAVAPTVVVGLPELTVISDSSLGETRRVELRVRPAAGTYSIRLRTVDTPVLSATVDGRVIDQTRYRSRSPQWSLGYVVPPADGFALSLVVPRENGLEFDVIARSLGLPPLLHSTTPSRPDNVVPIHSGDQTVVHCRIRL